jgi:hypothetical protein
MIACALLVGKFGSGLGILPKSSEQRSRFALGRMHKPL